MDTEGNPVAGVVVQVCKDECVPATSDDTGVATFKLEITEGYKLSVVTCPEGYEYTGEAEVALEVGAKEYTLTVQKKAENTDGGNTGNGGGTAVQQPTTTNPKGEEILGAGSKEQPYLEILTVSGNSMTVTTVNIPAGKAYYYGIQRVGNMILTINNANAYVIDSDGTRHDAKNGKVSFVVEDAIASDYVTFQIGNKGGAPASFTITFTNRTGSRMNPKVVNKIAETENGYTLNIAAGEAEGYFYTYKAEKAGTIKFYVSSYTSSVKNAYGSLNVTKVVNTIPYTYSLTDEYNVKTDANGIKYIEVQVAAGDTLEINVASACDSGRQRNPKADIVWVAKYQ